MRTLLITISIFLMALTSFGQNEKDRKTLQATRVAKGPVINGDLSDKVWENVPVAKDFVMMRPVNGQKEPQDHRSEVKLIYNDQAIYIAAYLYDPDPKNIPMEFTNRDSFGQSDFFLVTFNPNDDGQNPFEFIVMSTGSQAEAKISNGEEDFNWNAVWNSAVKVTDEGWFVEIEIPYRALRFANTEVQSWGINFHRNVKNLNAQYTWNFIDNTAGQWTQYDGLLENLRNIKPPTRLLFYPYASATSNTYDGESTFDYSVGMDVKYGITENFTLDATLIPDFGQTGFDNVELNLGPFEQAFSEQRQFFTEGTELFGKGDLFYSRRIGDTPTRYGSVESDLAPNEVIVKNPETTKMLNAIKVSGRTKGGLGIGIFNAITEKTEAVIRNTTTGDTYKKVTEPFANYNILVLDQQFNQNSSVTLINTNVTRDGDFRDANVAGLLYNVSTKDNRFFIDGSIKMSSIKDDGSSTGYSFDTSLGKFAGNWQYEMGYSFNDAQYDINDLGLLFRNNQQRLYGNISYRILQPTERFNAKRFNFFYQVRYLHNPGIYTGNRYGFNWFYANKERFSFGGEIGGVLGNEYDYFEARRDISENRFFIQPSRTSIRSWISTDYRKQFAIDVRARKVFFHHHPKSFYRFSLEPRYRFNNQFSMVYQFSFDKTYNDQGYVDETDQDIIFGQRDRKTIENTISAKYNFSIQSSLSLSFRHNWSTVDYESQFYNLRTDGYLTPNAYNENRNLNFNSWNVDLNYIWQFAPGSQLIAFYRNSIFSLDENADLSFGDNINNLFQQPKQHIFSLRLVYFIDYNRVKNIF